MFSRPFLALLGLGLLGAIPLFLLPSDVPETLSQTANAEQASSALSAVIVLFVILPAAVAIGVALAERVGVVSLIMRRMRGEPRGSEAQHWLRTIDLACIVGVCLFELYLLILWFFPEALLEITKSEEGFRSSGPFWLHVVIGLTADAITFELILRFGLVTLMLWLGGSSPATRRPAPVTWAALLTPCLLIVVLSLSSGQPVSWTILIYEGIGVALGLFYGWLYVSKALEHAILAHVVVHAVHGGISLVLLSLRS